VSRRATPLLRLGNALGSDLDARDLATDLVVDLLRDLDVLPEELAGILSTLAETDVPVVEPRARLRQDARRDADVEQSALAADALVVHDVELGDAERRRHLVLHALDPRSRADRVGAGLQRLDATDVQPHAGVELQGTSARRRLGIPEHHADLLAQLVREQSDRVGAVERACELAQRL